MTAMDTKASVLELQTLQTVLLTRVPGAIEAASNAISVQTKDATVRRHALLWKMELVPAYYQALFNPDPLAGTLDAWALSIQVQESLETGEMRAALEPVRGLALESAKQVRSQIEVAARRVANTPERFDKAQAYVEGWAKANPIEGPLSSRPSILTELAKQASKATDISVFQVVGNLPATVYSIGLRLDIYVAYLPRAAHWEAELMMGELVDRAEAQKALATLDSVQKLTERTNQLLSPEGIRAALAGALGDVKSERVAALSAVDQMRQETLVYISGEREAGVAAIDAQRRDVMADIDRQRAALMQQLDAFRTQSLADADAVATRLLWKGALATALLLVLAAGLTVLVLRSHRKQPQA